MKYALLLLLGISANAALIKSVVTNQGVTASYWKITEVRLQKDQMRLFCELSLYIDHDHAALNKGRIMMKDFHFNVISSDISGDLTAKCYEKIKAGYVNPAPSPAKQPLDKSLIGAVDG